MIRDFAIDFEEQYSDVFKFSILDGKVLLWPIVRAKLLLDLDDPACGRAQEQAKKAVRTTIGMKLTGLWTGLSSSALFARRPVVVFSTPLVNVRLDDGTYWNRLYGSMLSYWPEQIAIVEWGGHDSRCLPMQHKVYYPDLLLALVSIAARFHSLTVADTICIRQFLEYIEEHFLKPLNRSYDQDRMMKTIVDVARNYTGYRTVLSIWKRVTGVRFVIIEDAAYGGINAILVSVLKDLGVVVGELQHGLLYQNHMAYWYSDSVCSRQNNYHRYLPDYFFTYGQFWKQFIRIPARIISIGNDFLNKKARLHISKGRPSLLLVSGVIRYDLYVEILTSLSRKLDGIVDLILKPHPTERAVVEERYGMLSGLGVRIEFEKSIYDLLAEVDFVVGDHSTALVEAFAFGHTPLVFDSDYSRTALGAFPMDYFGSVDMLVEMLRDRLSQGRKELTGEASGIWERSFKDNFQSVLDEILNSRASI